LVSSNLARLRALADTYGFILVVDETVASFASVDVLSVADVIVTSLTKSFSGYADVIGGSIVLNLAGTAHAKLRALFRENWHNELFSEDAIVLERNNRDYLERSATLNNNAHQVASFLHSKATDPASSVSEVNYPSVNLTGHNFVPFMRAPTDEFTPGYGSLLSVEFDELDQMIAFYEALHVHFGPHTRSTALTRTAVQQPHVLSDPGR
jgi:cystathionine gamma-synthase